MTSLHVTTISNVEGTLNSWFVSQLALISLPSYLSSYATYFDFPENELTYPSFTFLHIPVVTRQRWQGNVENNSLSAVEANALLEINCWVNREALNGGQELWVAPLRFMQGMIEQICQQFPVVVIQDYLSNPSIPMATNYVVRIGDVQKLVTLPDPNPAIKRRRLQISYWWVQRA